MNVIVIIVLLVVFNDLRKLYVGGSKSSETSYIPNNRFIMNEQIMVCLLEAYVHDRISVSP